MNCSTNPKNISVNAVFLRKLVVDGSKGAVKIESTIISIPPIIRAIGGFRATNSKIAETSISSFLPPIIKVLKLKIYKFCLLYLHSEIG